MHVAFMDIMKINEAEVSRLLILRQGCFFSENNFILDVIVLTYTTVDVKQYEWHVT